MREKLAPTTIEKREQAKKRVFVEIGTSANPLILWGEKEFGEHDVYIGLDINKKVLKSAKKGAETVMRIGERPEVKNRVFMAADMRRLPLPDDSADQLFLGNVLGDPSIRKKEKDQLFEEIKRVLSASGEVIIKETNTPLPKDELSDLLFRHGFKILQFITPRDGRWAEEIQKYNKIEKENPYVYSYVVYAKQI
jgi:ubiquinone/menaquinone biosynthesis C-methylase UbiE